MSQGPRRLAAPFPPNRRWGVTGTDLLSFWSSLYLGPAVLIMGLGAYDLVTRRRLHPAYLAG